MNFKPVIILGLALLVAASGCVNQEETKTNSTKKEVEKIDYVSCEDIRIQIDQASSTALVRQMNQQPVGEITLNWSFENGKSSSKTVNLSNRGRLRFIESGKSGAVQQLEITSSRCPDLRLSSE